MHVSIRCLLFAIVLVVAGCGFHLRGNIRLAASLQRVYVLSSDQNGPLKHNIEDSLKRSGATVEAGPGEGIAAVKMTGVSLSTSVGSVSAAAQVNEFAMIYHVDLEIIDETGKVLIEKQAIEQTRRFTFNQNQAVGTGSEQEQIRREMERDMAQAVVRKIDAVGRKLAQ